MPSITDAINEKFGVAGGNIADALSQVAKQKDPTAVATDNIAEAVSKITVTETQEDSL